MEEQQTEVLKEQQEQIAKNSTNLIKKLTLITKEIDRVPKNGHNDFHNYDYATESDIKDVVRKKMAEHGVHLIMTELTRDDKEVATRNGKQILVTIKFRFTLLDAETGEKIEFDGYGDGQDAGDKAVYKAKTGAIKYALTNLFMIPTGDDPELEGKPLQPKLINETELSILNDLIRQTAEAGQTSSEKIFVALKNDMKVTKSADKFDESDFNLAISRLNTWKNNYLKKQQQAQQQEPNQQQQNQTNLQSIQNTNNYSWGR